MQPRNKNKCEVITTVYHLLVENNNEEGRGAY